MRTLTACFVSTSLIPASVLVSRNGYNLLVCLPVFSAVLSSLHQWIFFKALTFISMLIVQLWFSKENYNIFSQFLISQLIFVRMWMRKIYKLPKKVQRRDPQMDYLNSPESFKYLVSNRILILRHGMTFDSTARNWFHKITF